MAIMNQIALTTLTSLQNRSKFVAQTHVSPIPPEQKHNNKNLMSAGFKAQKPRRGIKGGHIPY